MNPTPISNLATPSGRAAYQEYWHDLIVERNSSVLPSLWQLWRMASFGSEMRISATDTTYRIAHPLGPRSGFRVFMEEIIVRHYYNNVQALVYFGAIILLTFLGLRFAGLLYENVALIGIAIEAIMLFVLFMVLFYAPEEEPVAHPAEPLATTATESDEESDKTVIREVLQEIEEIGSSYATLGMKIEHLARAQEEGMRELNQRVGAIQGLNLLESHAERLETTNTLLEQLTSSIDAMNRRIDMLFGKELEFYVRQEFERLVNNGTRGAADESEPRTGNANESEEHRR